MSDAEDAARYRWLKVQFEQTFERSSWERIVEDSNTRTVYEKVDEWLVMWTLKEDYRFGEIAKSRDDARSFDTIVDQLRLADNTSADPKA